MENYNFPLATNTWDGEEVEALQKVISSSQFTMGAEVEAFEREAAAKFGSRHCVMFNSGSSANLAALSAVKLRSKLENQSTLRDEVIVPAVSWSTTFFPVNQAGYKLRFVDIDSQTLNISIDGLKGAVNERTAGILAVNLLGNPADLIEIRKICQRNDLFFIEDNCESMGALLEGKQAGTFGEIGTFSTYFSHHISTMEGGFALTDDDGLFDLLLAIRAHGWIRNLSVDSKLRPIGLSPWEEKFTFVVPGYNLRPLEMEAAVGRCQLRKLDGIVDGRRKNGEAMRALLGQFPELIGQKENGSSSHFGFSLVINTDLLPSRGERQTLVRILESAGIQSRPIVTGNFLRQPAVRFLEIAKADECPSADWIHDFGLFIGNHHFDLERELIYLERALHRFVELAR